MQQKLTESLFRAVLEDLKKKVQAFSVFKGEYKKQTKELEERSADPEAKQHAKKLEKHKKQLEKLDAKFKQLKSNLSSAQSKAQKLKRRLENALSSENNDLNIIRSNSSRLKGDKTLLSPAEKAKKREIERLKNWLRELNEQLRSAHHLLNSSDKVTDPNYRDDQSWKLVFDKDGNPMLKSAASDSSQETIHFNPEFGISPGLNSVHIKTNSGHKPSFNPVDAFICKALFEKPDAGGTPEYRSKKSTWISDGPNLVDQLVSMKKMHPYDQRSHPAPPASSPPPDAPPQPYRPNFSQQLKNSYGHVVGTVHNNYGNREIINNRGELEGTIVKEYGGEFLVDDMGSSKRVSPDGTISNMHGVQEAHISNYSNIPPPQHSAFAPAPMIPVNTFMDTIKLNLPGSGSYNLGAASVGFSPGPPGPFGGPPGGFP